MALNYGEVQTVTTGRLHTTLIDSRFKELLDLGNVVLSTSRPPPPNVVGDNRVDLQKSQQWATSTGHLLGTLFGSDSEYYKRFNEGFRLPGYQSDMKRGIVEWLSCKMKRPGN